MNHGSLFSGIGGFDLAAQWMGWDNIFHCEWNKFGKQILNYYWPKAISYDDITKTDFTIHRGAIDILSGGFPCQPYSNAGKRKGKADERHLWPEMLRAIREIQPSYVVGENVRGLTNWNGGLVFDEVQADLEAEGYEVLPFLLPACAVNAPHRRDRIWFIAYSTINRRGGNGEGIETKKGWYPKPESAGKLEGRLEGLCLQKNITDSDRDGRNGRNGKNEINSSEGRIDALNDTEQICESSNSTEFGLERNRTDWKQEPQTHAGERLSVRCSTDGNNNWKGFPTQSPVCGGDDGLPTKLDGISFPKWRKESIKGFGNAVVPQVAFEIFKVIEKM